MFFTRKIKSFFYNIFDVEDQKLILGKLLSESVKNKKNVSFEDVEFKVFSQWGDDGIIQWLISNIEISTKSFIEFGVEDYSESNTRFLMMNNNWSGLVMDGSLTNIHRIKSSEYFWKHNLIAKNAFIDAENVNHLISSEGFESEVGLLHIDIDGNDYWVWKSIDCISPVILILEYNSVFGKDRAITVPYDPNFKRSKYNHTNLYYGASLKALYLLSKERGYSLVGCNSAGNNAYFVRNDKLNSIVCESSVENSFVESKFRESRDKKGNLTYISGNSRLKAIKDLPVYNVETDKIENL